MITIGLVGVIISLEIMCSILVAVSIIRPEHRFWPPKENRSPRGMFVQLLFNLIAGGIITLGALDWNSWVEPFWIRGLGGGLWLGGTALAIWAMAVLGLKNTTGFPGEFILQGPYRWTRNPQYLGFMVGLLGWGMMANSPWTLLAGLVGWVPLILVPRAEEPWLLEKYGQAYQEYQQKVPRFLF